MYDLGLDYYAKYGERTQAVTADEALAAAKKYLQADKLIVVAVGDRAKIAPALGRLNLGSIQIWSGQ